MTVAAMPSPRSTSHEISEVVDVSNLEEDSVIAGVAWLSHDALHKIFLPQPCLYIRSDHLQVWPRLDQVCMHTTRLAVFEARTDMSRGTPGIASFASLPADFPIQTPVAKY